jgi:hypothetical protein
VYSQDLRLRLVRDSEAARRDGQQRANQPKRHSPVSNGKMEPAAIELVVEPNYFYGQASYHPPEKGLVRLHVVVSSVGELPCYARCVA